MKDHKLMASYGLEPNLKGKTIIVQGFGNVGYWASHFCHHDGAKIIGVAEWDGSIYNPNGIDPDHLLEYKKKKGGIKDYPKAEQQFEDEATIYK